MNNQTNPPLGSHVVLLDVSGSVLGSQRAKALARSAFLQICAEKERSGEVIAVAFSVPVCLMDSISQEPEELPNAFGGSSLAPALRFANGWLPASITVVTDYFVGIDPESSSEVPVDFVLLAAEDFPLNPAMVRLLTRAGGSISIVPLRRAPCGGVAEASGTCAAPDCRPCFASSLDPKLRGDQ